MNFTAMSRRSLLRGAGATLSLGAVVRNGVRRGRRALNRLSGRRSDLGSRTRGCSFRRSLSTNASLIYRSPRTRISLTFPTLQRVGPGKTRLTLEFELRTDAVFHDGVPVTAEDFRYTFYDRVKTPPAPGQRSLDFTFIWRRIKDIEIASPIARHHSLRTNHADRREMAWLPGQLHHAQALRREGRPRRLSGEADRIGAVSGCRIYSKQSYHARSLRPVPARDAQDQARDVPYFA